MLIVQQTTAQLSMFLEFFPRKVMHKKNAETDGMQL